MSDAGDVLENAVTQGFSIGKWNVRDFCREMFLSAFFENPPAAITASRRNIWLLSAVEYIRSVSADVGLLSESIMAMSSIALWRNTKSAFRGIR